MKPKFFPKPEDFRKWLEKNHSTKKELQVGYYKKGSGKPSITWPESVDQALCFGWIDGVRNSIDDASYTIRFTPRKERSHWSAVNLKRYKELKKAGLIKPAGEKAHSRMDVKNSKLASFEQKEVVLDRTLEAKIRKNKKAWAYYRSLSPYNLRASNWWIMSAKQEVTQLKRLDILIKCCEAGERIPMLRPIKKK